MITVTAFRWVPPFAQGLVRDLRVRWALEEAGLPYEARLITPEDKETDDYRGLQPFSQVPVFEDGELAMFESGAIVLHLAERSPTLMPTDAVGRERARTWVLAALNSIEPSVVNLTDIDLFHSGEDWTKARRPVVLQKLELRLDELSRWLDGREYLEQRFSAGDLMMTTVLRALRHTSLVSERPVLAAYQARCEARPAFAKALADQLAPFAEAPVGA